MPCPSVKTSSGHGEEHYRVSVGVREVHNCSIKVIKPKGQTKKNHRVSSKLRRAAMDK